MKDSIIILKVMKRRYRRKLWYKNDVLILLYYSEGYPPKMCPDECAPEKVLKEKTKWPILPMLGSEVQAVFVI